MKQKTLVWSSIVGLTALATVGVTLFTQSTSPGSSVPQEALPQTGPALAPVQVLKPMRRDMTKTFTIPATIAPWQQATVYSRLPGYVKWIGVDKGDEVKRGQLLAVIDAPEIEQQYQEAEAHYEIKRVTYERYAKVWRDTPNVIAKQDVDVAEAEAKAARHIRDTRKAMVDYMRVYAPFAGHITARFMDAGSFIPSASGASSQGAALLTVMDLNQLRVYASVPQEVAEHIKEGLPVRLKAKDSRGPEVGAHVSRTTGVLDPATRTLLVEIDIDNADRKLQPGMFVTATFDLDARSNALVLPPSAIISRASGTKVVLTVAGGQVKETTVRTGLDDGVWVEVRDGLTGEEDVIVVGQHNVTVGQPVTTTGYGLPEGTPSSQKL